MSHDHHHDHGHHHNSFLDNLGAGSGNPFGRAIRVVVNLARRGRGGRPHSCCGNYGEPGC